MPATNADQEAKWIALADSIRAEVEKLVPLMPAMKPEEVKTLIDAAQAALWLDNRARSFEKNIDLELARVCYGD